MFWVSNDVPVWNVRYVRLSCLYHPTVIFYSNPRLLSLTKANNHVNSSTWSLAKNTTLTSGAKHVAMDKSRSLNHPISPRKSSSHPKDPVAPDSAIAMMTQSRFALAARQKATSLVSISSTLAQMAIMALTIWKSMTMVSEFKLGTRFFLSRPGMSHPLCFRPMFNSIDKHERTGAAARDSLLFSEFIPSLSRDGMSNSDLVLVRADLDDIETKWWQIWESLFFLYCWIKNERGHS